MTLSSYVQSCIYETDCTDMPEAFERFGILTPEDSSCVKGIRSFPFPESEHLFALLWDVHDSSRLSSTILPAPHPFIYQGRFQPGARTQLHSHEYLELFYVVSGQYRQKILGTEYAFHPGEFCLIDKNCMHQEILDGTDTTVIFFGITGTMFSEISSSHSCTPEGISSFLHMALLEQKSLQQFLAFHPKEQAVCSDVEETMLSLLQELKRHDAASPIICRGLLTRLILLLGTSYDFSLSKQLRRKMNLILLNQITDFMNRNLNHISIQSLSAEFHFHEDYFNRLLKNQTGLTYTEYLQSLRLRRAEQLLTGTDCTIEQIAEEIGYHNKGYFYRIFIDRYSCTPAQFRKRHGSTN